jgi:NADH dehydrogenase
MAYENILLLGGTGFVGQILADHLVARGVRVCVPTRRLAHARDLRVLPTIEIVQADVNDPATLRRLVAGRDAVINLVGVLHGGGSGSQGAGFGAGFAAAHVDLPRNLVAACREQGVARVLHVSALGADTKGPSAYLRSKGEGEHIVLSAPGLFTTVFRPSVVFGSRDNFLNLFAGLASILPVLFIGGANSRMQPVAVQDLAEAMCNALDLPATFGKSYEICGPTIYTLRELVQFAARAAGHPRPVIGLPGFAASIMAMVFEILPGPTLLSRDNLRSLSVDSIASTQPYRPAPELGLRLSPVEPEATLYLAGLHPRTRFSGFRARAGR